MASQQLPHRQLKSVQKRALIRNNLFGPILIGPCGFCGASNAKTHAFFAKCIACNGILEKVLIKVDVENNNFILRQVSNLHIKISGCVRF